MKKDKSIKKKIKNSLKRVPDYLYINYLKSWLLYRNNPNAVFIKIPKTAGTSLIDSLPAPKLKKLRTIKYRFIQRGIVTFGHMDYLAIVRLGLVTSDFDKSSFKFTFVRNPFDRAVSLYHHLMDHGRYDERTSFLDYCKIIRDREIEPIGLYAVRGYSQCNTQTSWTKGIEFDFIGRFENLSQDFVKINSMLGIESEALGHKRRSARKNYQECYCKESIEIIKTLYKEDFEAFDYNINELDYIVESKD